MRVIALKTSLVNRVPNRKGGFAVRAILRALVLFVICSQAWALGLADLTDKDASGGLEGSVVQGASGRSDNWAPMVVSNNPKVKIGLPDSLAPVEGVLRTMGRGRISTPRRQHEQGRRRGRAQKPRRCSWTR